MNRHLSVRHYQTLAPIDPTPPDFDRLARPYRFLEHLTLGRSLERCREHFLPRLTGCHHALVLGDGDGRFLARLFAANGELHADAVDLSARMLSLLEARCQIDSIPLPPASNRLQTHQVNALSFTPPHATRYDLVVTHFFLDCLTDTQLQLLTSRLAPHLAPEALWLVSDFRIPPSGPFRLPARLLVCTLYFAFRLLTGLRPTRLPDHSLALTRIGLHPRAARHSLFGLLTTELWSRR